MGHPGPKNTPTLSPPGSQELRPEPPFAGVSGPRDFLQLFVCKWNLPAYHGMGSQHPSPNVKNLCNFETQIWPEMITSHDAKSACFKGSRTSCTEINSGIFGKIWPEKTTSRDGCVLLMELILLTIVFESFLLTSAALLLGVGAFFCLQWEHHNRP